MIPISWADEYIRRPERSEPRGVWGVTPQERSILLPQVRLSGIHSKQTRYTKTAAKRATGGVRPNEGQEGPSEAYFDQVVPGSTVKNSHTKAKWSRDNRKLTYTMFLQISMVIFPGAVCSYLIVSAKFPSIFSVSYHIYLQVAR
jgi:hypothetical protein